MKEEYRVITVIFTKRRLRASEIGEQKRYQFLCEHDVKIGDMIDSPTYATPMEVVDVSYKDYIPVTSKGYLKTVIVDGINNKTFNNQLKQTTTMQKDNSMFSGLVGKYTSQFVPVKEDQVRMSMSGLLCVPIDNEYVGINSENHLVSFPIEMTLPIPVYSIARPITAIRIGDIVKHGKSYSKVQGLNPDGSIKVLSFTGVTHTKKAVEDFLMQQTTVRVLINMFNFDENSGFNPMLYAIASGETLDVQSLMMLSMTPQGKNLFSNVGGGFNPMMLMMMDKNRQENNGGMDMMSMMMMGSMMGGQNPFGNMFGQPAAQQPTPQPAAQTVAQPEMTSDQALEVLMKDKVAMNKLKELLKSE